MCCWCVDVLCGGIGSLFDLQEEEERTTSSVTSFT